MKSTVAPVPDTRQIANSHPPQLAPMAIIDIGSNSIRLVIYASQGRYPFPLFNERANCRLGEGVGDDGMLREERIEVALATLARFAKILGSMGISKVHAVATAAVRRAKNAEQFTRPAAALLNHEISVLSQQAEAYHVARGLTLNLPRATGLVADLGGGSIEIIKLSEGQIERSASFDFGHLSDVKRSQINAAFAATDWISAAAPKRLYGVGGSFRAFASAYIKQSGYPLPVLHGLTIPTKDARGLLTAFAGKSPELGGVPLGRQKTMPVAAKIIDCLLDHCGAKEIYTSGTSIRDGVLAERELNDDERSDFLQAVCGEISKASHRFADVPDSLFRFLRPLGGSLADAPEKADKSRRRKFERLLQAACLMSDLCWNEHEDIRGDIGARRVLGLPVNCVSHKERIWLATAIYHRYVGHKTNKSRPPELGAILGRKRRSEATTVGLGLRFALMFSGGTANCLEYLSLTNEAGVLTLRVMEQGRSLLDKHTCRRFAQLAQSASLIPEIEQESV